MAHLPTVLYFFTSSRRAEKMMAG